MLLQVIKHAKVAEIFLSFQQEHLISTSIFDIKMIFSFFLSIIFDCHKGLEEALTI